MQPCRFFAAAFLALAAAPPRALAAGPPVVLSVDEGADPSLVRRVRAVVASRRAIRDDLPLPQATSVSPERAAMEQQKSSIRLALGRAQKFESEAAWDDCVREAASALSDATVVLSRADDLGLLRDLDVQIGACMTLNQSAPSARPHLIAAALLDESPIQTGLHREEAERALGAAREEVLSRARGQVKIETTPPGAEIWIDGRRAAGVTPLSVDVRLGDHFITTRRFRFEPHTERAALVPSGVVRLALDPAQRDTLREQLAALGAARIPAPDAAEVRLARAVWSRAEQVVHLSPVGSPTDAGGQRIRVAVLDALTGGVVHASSVARSFDDAALRQAVCDALGETCEAAPRGIPWYVWPIGSAAVISGVIATAVIINNNRDFKLCPAAGCR